MNQTEYGRRKLADCIEILSKLDGSEEEMICKIHILTDLSFDENNFNKFRKSDILEIVWDYLDPKYSYLVVIPCAVLLANLSQD